MTSRIASPSPASLPDDAYVDAVGVLQRHASHPSAFLALNRDTHRFSVPGVDGLVAYRPAGRRSLVQLGGVFSDPADHDRILDGFMAMATSERRRVVAVQLMRADAERYAARGFSVNQFGAHYGRSLAQFSLRGSAHMQLRNKISRARRAGVVVSEVGVDVPATAGLDDQLDLVDAEWLQAKGRHVKELAFMVGERKGPVASLRRIFVATGADGDLLGYITFSPVYGTHAGWLHDLSRRRPHATPGTMELVIVTAVERFREEGASHLHFGLTPFTGLAPDHELSSSSRVSAGLVRLLADHGRAIYPAADQVAYKQKWAPDVVQPEYVAFSGGVSLRSVWALLRLTKAL